MPQKLNNAYKAMYKLDAELLRARLHPASISRAHMHEALQLLDASGVEREIAARWLHCIAIAIMDVEDPDTWADILAPKAPMSEAEEIVRVWTIARPN